MNDPEIRARLYPLLRGGVHIDELPTGSTRADVVHVTEHFMHGYEVKGDGDTLQRVENQLRCYAEVYDFVTFVVTEKHLAKLLPRLPAWVGVLVAAADGPTLRCYREAGYNATVQRAPLAGLLWVEEIKQFLLAGAWLGPAPCASAKWRNTCAPPTPCRCRRWPSTCASASWPGCPSACCCAKRATPSAPGWPACASGGWPGGGGRAYYLYNKKILIKSVEWSSIPLYSF